MDYLAFILKNQKTHNWFVMEGAPCISTAMERYNVTVCHYVEDDNTDLAAVYIEDIFTCKTLLDVSIYEGDSYFNEFIQLYADELPKATRISA